MYLGMVGRPALTNTYVSNIPLMLGLPNTLNTSNFYSKKVKDITMNNEQVFSLYKHHRDYTGIDTPALALGCLRYSPVFCKRYNMNFINKVLKANFSTNVDKLHPNWVTGFVDADGCFSIIIVISNSLTKVKTSFEINLHEKDKDILNKIKSFFGVGAVYHRSDSKISVYRVSNVNYIKDVIIPHFTNYPLISKKREDFLLWSEVIKLILNKDHLTLEGLKKILSYYASINKGKAAAKVLEYYPNIIPIDKPVIKLPYNLNPQWVSGFVAGHGGFSIYVRPGKNYALLEKVYYRFHIAQHIKDQELLKLFVKFFDCGVVAVRSNLSRCDFIVQDTFSLLDKVLPHFDTYPLLNLKQEDYICFKECITIIKLKKLTQQGLNRIKVLNLEMNSNRLK